jgi:hypothetical protein
MEQIVYISTARAVAPDAQLVEDILRVSRRNNRRDGLTGLLIVGGRRFLQVIEGPKLTLDAAFRRIKSDDRHFAVVELSRRAVTDRSFCDWDMAYQEGGSGEGFSDLVGIVSGMTEPLGDVNLKAQLRGFAELHSRAA